MPHFFIKSESVKENLILIDDKDNYGHIAKSLRAKVGEQILLIDEKEIQYECEITGIKSASVEVKIIKSYNSKRVLDFNLYLAQSPLRSDSQSTIIEKATELGVSGVYPIYTANCALKKSVIEQKIPKWQKIMYEASKQCERANIPECFKLSTIDKVILENKFDRIFAFTERSAQHKLKTYIRENEIKKGESILVIIGPEGGFSSDEFELFEKNSDIVTLSLGDLILKAETAVITALGNLIYEFE